MTGTNASPSASTEEWDRVKVLYILGWGRSGSTILDNILNQVDGFFSVGELHYLWLRGLMENRLCGCGQPIAVCPVWSRVLAELRENVGEALEPESVVALQHAVVRNRHMHRLMLTPKRWLEMRPEARSYAEMMAQLYVAIRSVTGARVIVDSTKRVPDALLLTTLPNVDPFFVHLVRDPRATAYSWQRNRTLPETGGTQLMRRFTARRSSLRWLLWSSAAERVCRLAPNGHSLLIRYEDFVASPAPVIGRIVSLLGEGAERLPFESDRIVMLGPNHTVSGNPSRFKKGPIELKRDDEWMARQTRRDAVISTLISLPLLHRYRYPLLPGPPGAAAGTDGRVSGSRRPQKGGAA